MKKMYSAFISSVYSSLLDERSEVIDSLLDYGVFPICMEHFTVSTSGKFREIEEKIDISDFFILLLGRSYGSVDDEGVSWTEREYRYAVKTDKRILAIVCDELVALREDPSRANESERRQLAFAEQVSFARSVSKQLTIPKIIGQFFAQIDFSEFAGWVRAESPRRSAVELAAWQEEHRAFDLAGMWYHVHFSADDETYIRVGTIQIVQQFDPDNYLKLNFNGYNYNVLGYDAAGGRLKENVLKRSHWSGEYQLNESGTIIGLFRVKREFSGSFSDRTVDKGIRRGIHDFTIDITSKERPERFEGEFHDEAPSPKSGSIYAFRTEEARLAFLKEYFPALFAQ